MTEQIWSLQSCVASITFSMFGMLIQNINRNQKDKRHHHLSAK